ncbi:ATP-binding cassette domain-containing protein, partial [Enterococcus faecalis]
MNGHSHQVLNGITNTLEKGNIFALVGPSGSGKSTLLNIFGGLI